MAQQLIHSGATKANGATGLHVNNTVTVDVYGLDSDLNNRSEFIFIPYVDSVPVVSSKVGYTKIYTQLPVTNYLAFTGVKLDFTDSGNNTWSPISLTNWQYGDSDINEGIRLFYRLIFDATKTHVIGIDRICIYDKDEIAPENICQFKTAKYCNLFPDYYEKDNEGNLIIDGDGNYILLSDWYQL